MTLDDLSSEDWNTLLKIFEFKSINQQTMSEIERYVFNKFNIVIRCELDEKNKGNILLIQKLI